MLSEGAVSPLVYVLLLAGGVGLGLPMTLVNAMCALSATH